MRDCHYCFNQRYLKNTRDEEIPCWHCEMQIRRPVDKGRARRALESARRAVIEKFQRDNLGKRKKEVS